MRNYPEWSIAFWAIGSIGAIVVPLNAWWTGRELQYGLSDSGAKLVIVDQQRLERLEEIELPPTLEDVVATRCNNLSGQVTDLQSLLEEVPADIKLPEVDVLPDDDATIFYTSGTTGFPKGTLGTQRNICSVPVTGAYNGVYTLLNNGGSLEDLAALQETQQAALLTVPLFHVTGSLGVMLNTLSMGGKLVMFYKWDPALALDAIEKEQITIFGGVPTMVWQLLDEADVKQCDLSSLRSILYGGAPAAPELLRRIKSLLPNAGAGNGWGITETSAAISGISGEDYIERPDSVGRPFPVCEVKVVDQSTRELPPNTQGELWVRGPNVTKGYWNKPEANAAAFSDGWFHTGDVGKIDENGFVYILDRLKDMIIRGGENVYCAEVEAALVEHPAVNAACVFGISHKVLGEEVAAVVEQKPGSTVTEQALKEHVAGLLAKFKVPNELWLRTEALPLGATGKLQKKELKAFYSAQLQGAGNVD